MFNDIKVIDCHVHCSAQNCTLSLGSFLFENGTDMANINACSHSRCIALAPLAMMLKGEHPGRFWSFAAPDLSAYYLRPDDIGRAFVRYGKDMLEMGADGIKLLEGKPQMRKFFPVPDFDEKVWEPFWAWCEEEQVPLLWHVNDPENFWDREHAPAFAVAQGWLYDRTYINNEEQYAQVLRVLERHPGLRVCFAHFFFMSAQLDRLGDILDRYPNVMTDLTPGIEMYENFSAQPEKSADFFEKYGGRICYGTDIGGRCVLMGEKKEFDLAENRRRPLIVREFLAGTEESEIVSDGHYLIDRPAFVMRPLALEGERLGNILGGNFERFVGGAPREVCAEAVLEQCAVLRKKLEEMERRVPGFCGSRAAVNTAESFFLRRT